ncbi:hypothetical protein ETH_00033935, partial [Eimeria tenella]
FVVSGGELPHSLVQQWAAVGLLLLKDHNKIAFVAGIQFAKACIRAGDMDDLAAWLPSMLGVLKNPNAPKARMKIRHLIEKLCKVMGEEAVEKAMPEEHMPLLRHLLRTERRRTVRRLIRQTLKDTGESEDESEDSKEERKGFTDSETEQEEEEEEKEKEKEERIEHVGGPEAVGLKSLLDAFEEDSEDDRRGRRKRRAAAAAAATGLSVFESAGGDDPTDLLLDFCCSSAAQQILAAQQPRKDRRTAAAAKGQKRELKFSQLKLNSEGKILLSEEEEDPKNDANAPKFSIGKETPASSRRKGLK